MTTNENGRPAVLVADDDPVFGSLAEACLDAAGFAPLLAEDGADAIDLLMRHRFDLAIIDLDMPEIDGFRLIGLIRGRPSLWQLGILVISSSRRRGDYEESLRVGADAYLAKPVDWQVLPATVAALIEAKKRQPPPQPVLYRRMGGR